MRNDFYPEGTAEKLLQTGFLSPQTKKVFVERLHTPVVSEPAFFTKPEFITLQAVSKRMLPQPKHRKQKIDLAGVFDTNYAKKKPGNGWRYNDMPPDEVAIKEGLKAIEASSQSRYGKAFDKLKESDQDELLQAVYEGKMKNAEWHNLPSDRFFEELFSSLVEIYYSHPFGRDEIGDVSYADTKGWHQIQLHEKEEREPVALDETSSNNEQNGR